MPGWKTGASGAERGSYRDANWSGAGCLPGSADSGTVKSPSSSVFSTFRPGDSVLRSFPGLGGEPAVVGSDHLSVRRITHPSSTGSQDIITSASMTTTMKGQGLPLRRDGVQRLLWPQDLDLDERRRNADGTAARTP